MEANSTKQDYHGHPNYFLIYISLVVILALSIAVGELLSRKLAIAMIFALAIVKALLVLGNFMHLRWEPRLVWVIALSGVIWALIFYILVLPDIVPVAVHIAS